MIKIRISKNGKFSKLFPTPVANRIRQIAQDYSISTVNISEVDAEKKFYVGEGERYTGLFPNGREASFEVVSSNTIGASNVSHRIGEQFSMPSGTYLVRVSYYTKYWMNVYKVSDKMIDAAMENIALGMSIEPKRNY